MQFSAENFQVLCFKPMKLNEMQTGYTGPDGTETPESKSEHDLGIAMSNSASFQLHITKLAIKYRWLARWIL